MQEKLRQLREKGGAINTTVALAVARGILKSRRQTNIQIGKGWVKSLFSRMGLSKRRATTGKLPLPAEFIDEQRRRFVTAISHSKDLHKISDRLIINWDQTPLKLVPSGNWTMEKTGTSKVSINGLSDKRNITSVITVDASGEMLPMQLIYSGKTVRSVPKYTFPDGFHVTQNENHWSTEHTMLEYIEYILKPHLTKVRAELESPEMPAILLYDVFRAHTTPDVKKKLDELNVIHHQIPPNMTDHLQPLDVAVNKPIKDFLRNRFSEWYADVVMSSEDTDTELDLEPLKSITTLREIHAGWLGDLYKYFKLPDQMQIIRNGFIKVGISSTEITEDDPFADCVIAD